MIAVLMLFLIPIGGGIPAGVLLAQKQGLFWPITAGLYFISDVILAFAFEPVLWLIMAIGRRFPALARATEAVRQAMERTAVQYGGTGAGPVTLIMIAFGVDPMTGRAAAAAAGHGFISGWAIAIAGDMIYFAVIMIATLRLSAIVGDPNRTVALVLGAMIIIPIAVRRVKAYWQ